MPVLCPGSGLKEITILLKYTLASALKWYMLMIKASSETEGGEGKMETEGVEEREGRVRDVS